VIVYTPHPDDAGDDASPANERTIAIYFTTHPADFTERFGVPEGGMDDLARTASGAPPSRPDDDANVLPIYAAAVELTLADIKIATDDVVCAGRFHSVERCRAVVQLAAQMYMVRYSEQLVARSGLSAEDEDAPEDTTRTAAQTYQQVPEAQISDHLQTHYIAPIMHALEDADQNEARRIAQDFLRFCGRSGPLTADAYALAAVVQSSGADHKATLLYKYFEKILAVTAERFEDAARLRDEIEALAAEDDRT